MVQVVRSDDVERMLREAFQQGHADDPQLIPNLITSLRHFMPTFDVELKPEQIKTAEDKVQESLEKFMIF